MSSECKTETTASPGFTGIIKFKCMLWANCPLYKRLRQDQTFIFSPETLSYAPQSLRDKISAIPNLDGVFLKPRPNFYLNNFLAFRRRSIQATPPVKNSKDAFNGLFNNAISLVNLQFLGLVRSLTANELVLDGGAAVTSTAIASHQTWIADGSLYCSENVLPSEYLSLNIEPNAVTKTTRSFCTKWSYVSQPKNSRINSGKSNSFVDDNYIQVPTVDGIFVIGNDPIKMMTDNGVKENFQVSTSVDTYKNINPGLHWRVLKRLPIFQGEDFVVEFQQAAPEGSNISSSASFRMLDKFRFLDVNNFISKSNCGAVDNQGLLDIDKNNQIIEATKKVFDFTRQIYYMIEIGIGDPNHNYWIIIAENTFPIFCHVGKTPYLTCATQSTQPSTPSAGNNSSPPVNCVDNTSDATSVNSGGSSEGTLQEVNIVENPKDLHLRRLSTYDAASSRSLLKNPQLRISIRQHGGNIVVTFSGYEDKPWVITRKDIDPDSTPVDQPVTESQITYKPIRMKIPGAQIAIMGGNIKCGFTFSPQTYESLTNYKMPQPFSVQGPIDITEIEVLLRDKAISQNPEVSLKTPPIQFTNEATFYGEIATDPKDAGTSNEGKVHFVATKANDVQPDFVKEYGKAPYEFSQSDVDKYGIDYSYISVNDSECTTNAGSTADTSKLVQVALSVAPGDFLFPAIDGGDPWLLKSCVTPIFYFLRLYVPPDGCIFDKTPLDVTQHVLTFGDEWSETDWQKLEHQGTISFLINEGMKFKGNQSNYISSLVDKAFYLQISMWWEGGIMPTPENDIDKVVFTGFCPGGTIGYEANQRVLECRLFDYSQILKDQMFLNSPFFDRMRDVNAIQEILQMAGLRDGEDNNSTTEPGSMVRLLANSNPTDEWYSFFFNGEKIITREFALPGSYDILQAPFMRFNDGQRYWEAIDRISLLANKVAYFDRLGVFNFHALPYDQELFGGQQGTQANWTIQDWGRLSKADFFATPKDMPTPPPIGNQIFGNYTVERLVQDVVNEIKIISTSPNGEILIAGHTNFASLTDPTTPGFLGYHKMFLQMDGIFGTEQNVKWMVKNYTRMFIPPIKVCFKAMGRNNIKALDVVTFQPIGSREKQPLIVSSIRNQVDASKNTWIQEYECLWLFPAQNVQWGNSNEIGLGLDGSVSGL